MIFNLFKEKPTLKELIPDGFVDIHSHVLPGIDDGAKNIEESIKLISFMKTLGIKKIIATPHIYPKLYENNIESIKKVFNSLFKKPINIDIKYGAEYLLTNDLIEKARNKELITLGNTNYVLIEFSFLFITENFHDILFNIIINGYQPIIAHPERYLYMKSDFDKFYKLKKIGCKFQLNMFSIIGAYGGDVANLAFKLIKMGLIDFIATDLHRLNRVNLFNEKITFRSEIKKIESIFENSIYMF